MTLNKPHKEKDSSVEKPSSTSGKSAITVSVVPPIIPDTLNNKNIGDGELDKILDDWFMKPKNQLKTAIQKWAAQEANKTAIDELEGILNCWEHPSLAPHFLTDRIAQLTVIQNKLEGLQNKTRGGL